MLGRFKIETENKIANEELIKIKNGEICEYKLKIEFAESTNPSIYSIIRELDYAAERILKTKSHTYQPDPLPKL